MRIIARVTKTCTVVAEYLLAGVMLLVVANVVGRKLGFPILGYVDYSAVAMAVIASFVYAHTAVAGRHISVGMVTEHLRPRARAVLRSIVLFLSVLVIVPVIWGQLTWAWEGIFTYSDDTEIAGIPIPPFRFIFAFGLMLLVVVWVIEAIRGLFVKPEVEERPEEVK